MIKKTIIPVLIMCCLLIACNHTKKDNAQQLPTSQPTAMAPPRAKKKFADVQFASRIDTICGMPIKAGIEDTVVLKGKVYGFCATACKEEFVKMLQSQHKR